MTKDQNNSFQFYLLKLINLKSLTMFDQNQQRRNQEELDQCTKQMKIILLHRSN